MKMPFFSHILFAVSILISTSSFSAPSTAPHIAITKFISHPSLNKIEQGIIDHIKTRFPEAIFSLSDAQGNITTAAQIAQKYAAQHFDLVIPITTPSAQTIYSAFRGSQTPILFAAVTDPMGANLVKCLDQPPQNITGVVDYPPIHQALALITTILDNVTKIGVVYNAGEANSDFQISLLRKAAETANITIVEVPVAKASDIQMAVQSIVHSVDCLFLPNDNLVISSLESVLKITRTFGKLVFVSDPESIDRGAFAAVAFDQYKIGLETGALAVDILTDQVMPPLTLMTDPEVFINKDLATEKGLLDRVKAHLTQCKNLSGDLTPQPLGQEQTIRDMRPNHQP